MRNKNRKLFSIVLLVAIVFNTVFGNFAQINSVNAQGLGRKLDFTMSMTVNGNKVDLESMVTLKPGDEIKFSLEYSEDNLDPVPEEGDEVKFKLPSVFENIIPTYPEIHFKGIKIENGEVILTCGPDIADAVGGEIVIESTVGEVEHEMSEKLEVEVNGEDVDINITTKPSEAIDTLIDKKVDNIDNNYDIESDEFGSIVGQEIPYSIAINEKYTKMDNATLTDNIPEGMELVEGSISLKKIVNGEEVEVTPVIISKNPLKIDLGDINHKHVLSYKLKIVEEKKEYVNEAIITSDTTKSEKDKVVAVPEEDIKGDTDISKSVVGDSVIKPDANGSLIGKEVSFEVKVNSNKTDKDNVKFKDMIPQGMALDLSSIEIVKVKRGIEQDVTDKFSDKIKYENDLFEVDLGDIKSEYIIRYKVIIDEDMDSYENTAGLNWNGGNSDATSTVKPKKPTKGEGTVDKSADIWNYDEEDDSAVVRPNDNGSMIGKNFSYSIVVNNELEEKSNLKLSDMIPEGMELVLSSVKVFKDVGAEEYKDVTNEVTINKSADNLEILFGDTSDRYRVEYHLRVTEDKENYVNTAKLEWGEDGKSEDSSTITPQQPNLVGNTDLVKKINEGGKKDEYVVKPNEDGIYDQTIKYEIAINDKYESKSNTVFVDNIPEGMVLDIDTVKVVRVNQFGNWINETETLGDKIQKSESKLQINFGDITDKYLVTYETKIVEYKPEGWRNNANLTWGDGGNANDTTIVNPQPPTKGPGNLDKNANDVVLNPDEDGNYIGNKIDYSILVNNELENKINLTLTDKPLDGMKILTDTVKVYRDTGNKYEDITNKDIVKINASESILTVEFGNTSSRYKVEYQTEITANKDSYINTAVLNWDGGSNQDIITTEPNKPQVENKELTKTVNGKDEEIVVPDSSFIGREFDYELLVNAKLEEKKATTLTDTLPSGMQLVKDSIRIFKDYGGNVYGDVTDEFDGRITQADNYFTINFGDIKDRYKVIYKTKITELIESGYINEAVLVSEGSTEEKATATIKPDLTDVDPEGDGGLLTKSSEKTTVSNIGDKVEYTVKINENNKRLKNLKFEDDIPDGMKLLSEGFRVLEKTDKGEVKDITTELLSGENPKASLEEDKMTINFGETYSSYTVSYVCEVTEIKSNYENTAKITAEGIEVVKENNLNYEVDGGGISASKTADKTQINNSKEDQTVVYSIKVWSDAVFPAGYLNIEDDLDDRLIYLGHEAPDYMDVKYDETTHTLKVVNIKEIPETDKTNPIEIKITTSFENVKAGEVVGNIAKINDTQTPEVVVKKGYKFEGTKVDGDNNNSPLQGVKFELYKINQKELLNFIPYGKSEEVYIKDIISDENGKISSDLDEPGRYILREVETLEGYDKLVDDIEFEVENSDVGTTIDIGNVVNHKTRSKVEVKKVDKDNHDVVLQGAEFTIKKDGEIIAKEVTNEDGIARFENLEDGIYTIEETKAPEGYIKSDEVKTFEVKISTEVIEFVFENIKKTGAVELLKLDKDNKGTSIEGAKFQLLGADKTTIVREAVSTNTEGKVVFGDLKPGTYYFQETESAPGYVLNGELIEVVVGFNQTEVATVTFENARKTGAVELLKVDADDKTSVIEGAKFQLLGADKTTIVREAVSTNAEGKVVFGDLKPGTYYFQETESAPGYVLNGELIEVVVGFNQTEIATVTFENKKIVPPIVDPDKDTNTPDSGKEDNKTEDDSDEDNKSEEKSPDTSDTSIMIYIVTILVAIVCLVVLNRNKIKIN